MSLRFINRQQRKRSCGPTAIANVLKWLGCRTSHDHIVEFCSGIRTYDPRIGMYPSGFRYTLRKLNVKFRVSRKTRIDDIDSALSSGKSLIFAFRTKTGHHHAVFIDARDGERYRVWNRGMLRKTSPWCSRKYITNAIRRTVRHDGHCYAYYIIPENQ